jgi:hypothetical protein
MRSLAIGILAVAASISADVTAQEGGWVKGSERWNSCYKETRLMYRTRNMSLSDFRAMIKTARRSHMRECMTRARPPAPVTVATPLGNHPETGLVSWAGPP